MKFKMDERFVEVRPVKVETTKTGKIYIPDGKINTSGPIRVFKVVSTEDKSLKDKLVLLYAANVHECTSRIDNHFFTRKDAIIAEVLPESKDVLSVL